MLNSGIKCFNFKKKDNKFKKFLENNYNSKNFCFYNTDISKISSIKKIVNFANKKFKKLIFYLIMQHTVILMIFLKMILKCMKTFNTK